MLLKIIKNKMRIQGHEDSISEEINFTDINESQIFKRMGVSNKGCTVKKKKNVRSTKIQGRRLNLANKRKDFEHFKAVDDFNGYPNIKILTCDSLYIHFNVYVVYITKLLY